MEKLDYNNYGLFVFPVEIISNQEPATNQDFGLTMQLSSVIHHTARVKDHYKRNKQDQSSARSYVLHSDNVAL